MGLTLGQMYLLGRHRVLGWPVGVAGNALWIAWSVGLGLWSILAINLLLAVLSVRGWFRWNQGLMAAGVSGGEATPLARAGGGGGR